MQIQCNCGTFKADAVSLPRNTPGRLACYCDDCQKYLIFLKRTDLLDKAGGTEVVPVYPSEFKILSGQEQLRCIRLSDHGLFRWRVECCNTPICNSKVGFPWVGLFHQNFTVNDPDYLKRTFGRVRSRIMGKFAKGTPPEGTANTFELKSYMSVMPFLLKGFLLRKAKNSPFYDADGNTPIVTPHVLSSDERARLDQDFQKIISYR